MLRNLRPRPPWYCHYAVATEGLAPGLKQKEKTNLQPADVSTMKHERSMHVTVRLGCEAIRHLSGSSRCQTCEQIASRCWSHPPRQRLPNAARCIVVINDEYNYILHYIMLGRLWVCHFVKCGPSFKQQVPRSDSLCIRLLAMFSVSSRTIRHALQSSMQAFCQISPAPGSKGPRHLPKLPSVSLLQVPPGENCDLRHCENGWQEGKHCAKTWCKGRKQRTKLQRKRHGNACQIHEESR